MGAARKLYVADLFCGAGGTSTGVAQACRDLGLAVELLAINHWGRAIETHKKNHPWARHLCASLETLDPRKVVPGGHLDLLVASPECTHHSTARGGRPINDQSRASAFRVLEWCDKLHVSNVLVENVPEFLNWAPIGSNGRPLKSKRGEIFRQWIGMLKGMNYRVDWRILNAADYGGATTRKRLFIVARKGTRAINWPEPTHAKDPGTDLFGTRKPWRTAREIIDWSIRGKSIFRRKEPLAKTTLERILAGLIKFGGPEAWPLIEYLKKYIARIYPPLILEWKPEILACQVGIIQPPEEAPSILPAPFITVLQKHTVSGSIESPFPTFTAQGNKLFLCEPFLLGQQSQYRARSVKDPVPTISTKGAISLITPFLVPFFGERSGQHPRFHSVEEPLPAVTSHGAGGVVEPFIITPGGADLGVGRPVNLPLPTVLTSDRFGLVSPFLLNFATNFNGRGRAGVSSVDRPTPTQATMNHVFLVSPFLVNMKGCSTACSVECPAPTQTTRNHIYVAQPFILPQNNGNRPRTTLEPFPTITTTSRGIRFVQAFIVQAAHGGGLARRIHSLGAPLPTQPCTNRFGLVQPFFVGSGGPTRAADPVSTEEPLGTVLTKNYRALTMPFVIQTSNTGGNGVYVRAVDRPLYTIVTQSQLGLVEPYVVKVNHGEASGPRNQSVNIPLHTVTGKNGFGLVQPFLVKFYRDPQTQNQSVLVPLHAVTTKSRFGLVIADPELGEPPGDIFFRMMISKELARAMGFEKYVFTGNQEERVKQIGNAVEVNTAKALVRAILDN